MDSKTLLALLALEEKEEEKKPKEGHELREFYEFLKGKHSEFRREEAGQDALATLVSLTEDAEIRTVADFHNYINLEAYHIGSRRRANNKPGDQYSDWDEAVRRLALEAFEKYSPKKNAFSLASSLNRGLFGEELKPRHSSHPPVVDHP